MIYPPLLPYFRVATGGRMERVNGFPVFMLGEALTGLASQFGIGRKYSELIAAATYAKQALEFVLGDQFVPMKLSRDHAKTLLVTVNSIIALAQEPDRTVNQADVNQLGMMLIDFRAVLSSELSRLNVFFVSARRAWDTDTLLENAEKLLSTKSREALNAISTWDIQEAGRCILWGLPTAAGFHIIRLLETFVLLYFSSLGITVPPEKDRSLGNYLRILETHGVDNALLNDLRDVKDAHRNRLMHPEKVLTQEEAENLLGLAEQLTERIVTDVARLAEKHRQNEGETKGTAGADHS